MSCRREWSLTNSTRVPGATVISAGLIVPLEEILNVLGEVGVGEVEEPPPPHEARSTQKRTNGIAMTDCGRFPQVVSIY